MCSAALERQRDFASMTVAVAMTMAMAVTVASAIIAAMGRAANGNNQIVMSVSCSMAMPAVGIGGFAMTMANGNFAMLIMMSRGFDNVPMVSRSSASVVMVSRALFVRDMRFIWTMCLMVGSSECTSLLSWVNAKNDRLTGAAILFQCMALSGASAR